MQSLRRCGAAINDRPARAGPRLTISLSEREPHVTISLSAQGPRLTIGLPAQGRD